MPSLCNKIPLEEKGKGLGDAFLPSGFLERVKAV